MKKLSKLPVIALILTTVQLAMAEGRPDHEKFHQAFEACVSEGIARPEPGVRTTEMDACLETKGISAPPERPDGDHRPRDPASAAFGDTGVTTESVRQDLSNGEGQR